MSKAGYVVYARSRGTFAPYPGSSTNRRPCGVGGRDPDLGVDAAVAGGCDSAPAEGGHAGYRVDPSQQAYSSGHPRSSERRCHHPCGRGPKGGRADVQELAESVRTGDQQGKRGHSLPDLGFEAQMHQFMPSLGPTRRRCARSTIGFANLRPSSPIRRKSKKIWTKCASWNGAW